MDEGDSECLPISKRINSLSLDTPYAQRVSGAAELLLGGINPICLQGCNQGVRCPDDAAVIPRGIRCQCSFDNSRTGVITRGCDDNSRM